MNTNQFYIGFTRIGELLSAAEEHGADRRAYISLTHRGRATGISGLTRQDHHLTVQVPAPPYLLYASMHIGTHDEFAGEMIPGREKISRRGESALGIVRDFMREHGYSVHEALVAMPEDLRTLVTVFECMRYDKESDTFVSVNSEVGV